MLNKPVSFVRRNVFRLLLLVLISIILCVSVAYYAVKNYLETPISLNQPMIIMIEPGRSLTQVTRRLEQEGVLRWPRILVLWARWQEIDRSMRTGEYELTPGLTPVT
jgi:UPF0755 protein